MSQNLVVNGVTYPFPDVSDQNWGQDVTDWANAVTGGMLQKAGGSFTLTAEVDFGASYGAKSLYMKSRGANPSTTGIVRLANTESVSWRDAANAADLALSVNASDVLTFAGNPIVSKTALTASRALVSDAGGVITVSAATAAEVGYLSGVTSAIQTQINSKITAGAAAIVNADVHATAAIAVSKLAALTASRAVVTDASGFIAASSATSTEVGYLSGVTSAIQTQINALAAPGMVAMYGGAAAPSGWLLCDGGAVSRTTYAALFTAIGTTYGVGDNSTTFNVPDFRGIFPKGAGTTDRAAGKDSNGNYYAATLGAYATDKMQGHLHPRSTGFAELAIYDTAGSGGINPSGAERVLSSVTNTGSPVTDATNGAPRTGMTTEPQSLGISFIIKT